MTVENVAQVADLKEYGINTDDLEVLINELPEYSYVKNKGRLDDSREYSLSRDEILEDDEKPDQVGRDGESSLGVGYSDFEVLLAGMVGEGNFNVSEDQRLHLPEENQQEALGALFGASYAIFRYNVMEEGFPADHDSFEQEINSQEERERFFEEGAYEIQGEIMGSWGYDPKIMTEVMDPEQALETYNKVVEELV